MKILGVHIQFLQAIAIVTMIITGIIALVAFKALLEVLWGKNKRG